MASCGLYLFLAVHTPLGILASGAGHDDGLFLGLAREIAAGRWLGAYDERTLIKGPGYPLYLALVAWSGLPLTLANGLLHVAAALLVGALLERLTSSLALARIASLALLFSPAALSSTMRRVIRDSIYPDFVLIAVAMLGWAWFVARTPRSRWATGLASGLLLAWVWLTREEGVWLLPLVAMALLAAVGARVAEGRARSLAAWTAILACAAGFALGHGAFRTANFLCYGTAVGLEVRQSDFLRAMAALESVRAGADVARVPVTRAAREQIYAASPAFAALRPVLDPPSGPAFQFGCHFYPETCGEIAGGWFLWAVRAAAAEAGFASSPSVSAVYYRQLAGEVESACASGRLRCDPGGLALLPRISAEQWAKAPPLALAALSRMALVDVESLPPPESRGDLSMALDFLHHPAALAPPGEDPRFVLGGWYHHPDGSWFRARLRKRRGAFADLNVIRQSSPGLPKRRGDPKATRNRFSAEGRCDSGCVLLFEGAGKRRARISIGELDGKRKVLYLGRGKLVLDSVRMVNPTFSGSPRAVAAGFVGVLRALYSTLLAPTMALGLAGLALATVRAARRRRWSPLLGLALGAWLAALARLVLLVVISLGAFPALALNYVAPSTALALLGSLAALRCALAPGRAADDRLVAEGAA